MPTGKLMLKAAWSSSPHQMKICFLKCQIHQSRLKKSAQLMPDFFFLNGQKKFFIIWKCAPMVPDWCPQNWFDLILQTPIGNGNPTAPDGPRFKNRETIGSGGIPALASASTSSNGFLYDLRKGIYLYISSESWCFRVVLWNSSYNQ